ncbi:hypothetical protein DH2020_048155 [Rehmannia glutinosa]|uniref:DDE Tnp4 domain-containing protein n=1 Tax=Rehmannia glutinosa TaxID=99300 RepID=A0ABR0U7E9_REHGL
MNFIYVLSGWEGSAADCRILRDAVTRPNGLKVPQGNYYLCDNGYTNGEGFLTPYKGVRYHLNEWGEGTQIPQNSLEFLPIDPLEDELSDDSDDDNEDDIDTEFIDTVESSQAWNNWRDNLSHNMYNEWRGIC